MQRPKVLILTIPHGAAHQRVATALRDALVAIQPELTVEITNALEHCTGCFRAYYNSYEIPLKYWPGLWGWIENKQHRHTSTGPRWLYRRGGQGLFRFIEAFDPDIVITTEVSTCELAAMLKRERRSRFYLVGASSGVDIDRPWAQPEVDLFPVAPGVVAAQLEAAGVPASKILTCGTPLDPAFGSLPERVEVRARLNLEQDIPLILVLFGGTGFGSPRRIFAELQKVHQPLQVVSIAGKNRRLHEEAQRRCEGQPRYQSLGWVNNMHEWLAAADLLVSKPGGMTVIEALNSSLPLLAFDPLPGAERRACELIEREWQAGYWIKRPNDLAPMIERLLTFPEELQQLRANARALARPHAARHAAEAILKGWAERV
jgi:processive 1,2-diacylglycerol beta-glucosyltransferase